MQQFSGLQPIIRLLFLALILVGGSVSLVYAAPDTNAKADTVSQDTFDAYKELTNTKLDAAKESLQKDVQNFAVRVDGQDKRIDQQNARIGDINTILTFGGLLLALVAIVASMIGYFSVKTRAREEAREVAEQWFEQHSQRLREQLRDFEKELTQLHSQAKTKTDQHCEQLEELRQQARMPTEELQEQLKRSAPSHTEVSSDQYLDLQKFVESLVQQKLESEYTFDDWNKRAFAELAKNADEAAIHYWRKALTSPKITEVQSAETLFNIGQGQLRQAHYKESITSYDKLFEQYRDSAIPSVQGLRVHAIVNKGTALGRLGCLAEAVACYNDVLERYSTSENPMIQKQYHSAEANMAELLLILGRSAEAVPRLRQLLARTDAANQQSAIMPFLLWLVEADTNLMDVLNAIRLLSPEVQFTWSWTEIRPLVDKLPEPRKTQARCFITFFEHHHDLVTLESCLSAVST